MGILEEKKKIEMRVSEDSRRETAHAIQPFGEKAHLLLKIKILMWGAGGWGGIFADVSRQLITSFI